MGLFRKSRKELIAFYQHYFPEDWERRYDAHIKHRRERTKLTLSGLPIIGGIFKFLLKV
ncbi:MAG: hypothetical protein ACYTGS_16515 [Planctomycetota bacterium]|jgi:hypothetical protein